MKQISKWALGGMGFGLIFAIGSFVRYFFWTIDVDRAIVYPIIGILIFAVSWLYNQRLQDGYRIDAIEEYITDRDNNGRN